MNPLSADTARLMLPSPSRMAIVRVLWLAAGAAAACGGGGRPSLAQTSPTTSPTSRPAISPPEEWLLSPDTLAVRALLAELGESYRAVRSAHFVIVSDAAIDLVKALAELAEGTLHDVRRTAAGWKAPIQRPAHKMTIVYMSDARRFEVWLRRAGLTPDRLIPGFFEAAGNRCVVLNLPTATTSPVERSRDESALRVGVRHEVAHLVLHNVGLLPGPPRAERRWLEEGLAMRFETPEPLNTARLEDFLAAGRSLNADWLRGLVSDGVALDAIGDGHQTAYAAAWALAYYLSETQPAAFATCVRGSARTPGDGAASAPTTNFERTFGRIDAAFVEKWREYMAGLTPREQAPASRHASDQATGPLEWREHD